MGLQEDALYAECGREAGRPSQRHTAQLQFRKLDLSDAGSLVPEECGRSERNLLKENSIIDLR